MAMIRVAIVLALVTLLQTMVSGATGKEGDVAVSITPVFAAIQRSQKVSDFQVLVNVEAPPLIGNRVAVDLVVVVDVDEWSLWAPDKLKQAVTFVATRILRDDDGLAILINPPPADAAVPKLLRGAEGRGQAAQGKGMSWDKVESEDAAVTMLKKAHEILKGTGEGRGFIMLVSDRSDPPKLESFSPGAGDKKRPIHTLGIGASHGRKALYSIADGTSGTYSFVDLKGKDDKFKKIEGALALGLGGLRSVVASNVKLTLEALGAAKNKVMFYGDNPIHSGSYVTTTGGSGDKKVITIGVLYAGETKNFVVHLTVPSTTESTDGTGSSCHEQNLLKVTVTSQDNVLGSGKLSIRRPERDDAAPRVPSALVLNYIFLFQALGKISRYYDGSVTQPEDTGSGLTVLEEWGKFVQDYRFWYGLDFLGRLDTEITGMITSLQDDDTGAAAAYIYAWLSSYRTQRPTSIGSPENHLTVFITVDITVTLRLVLAPHPYCKQDCPTPKCVTGCGGRPITIFKESEEGEEVKYYFNEELGGTIAEIAQAINSAMEKIYMQTCGLQAADTKPVASTSAASGTAAR